VDVPVREERSTGGTRPKSPSKNKLIINVGGPKSRLKKPNSIVVGFGGADSGKVVWS